MKKEEQTEEVKMKLWDLTKNFVFKWWIKYYPAYKGGNPSKEDLEDLVADFYVEFLTPKAKEGEKETLLDKFDTSKVYGDADFDYKFAQIVKIAVIRKLIDAARSEKYETNYVENYDDDDPNEKSLDYLASKAPADFDVKNLEFDDDQLEEAISNWNKKSEREKKFYRRYFNEQKEGFDPKFRDFMSQVVNS